MDVHAETVNQVVNLTATQYTHCLQDTSSPSIFILSCCCLCLCLPLLLPAAFAFAFAIGLWKWKLCLNGIHAWSCHGCGVTILEVVVVKGLPS